MNSAFAVRACYSSMVIRREGKRVWSSTGIPVVLRLNRATSQSEPLMYSSRALIYLPPAPLRYFVLASPASTANDYGKISLDREYLERIILQARAKRFSRDDKAIDIYIFRESKKRENFHADTRFKPYRKILLERNFSERRKIRIMKSGIETGKTKEIKLS